MVSTPHSRCTDAVLCGNHLAEARFRHSAVRAALLWNGSLLAGAQSHVVFPSSRTLPAGSMRVVLDNLPYFRRAGSLLAKVPGRVCASTDAQLGGSSLEMRVSTPLFSEGGLNSTSSVAARALQASRIL